MNTLLASLFFLLALAHSGGDPIDPQEGIGKADTIPSAVEGEVAPYREESTTWPVLDFLLTGKMFLYASEGISSAHVCNLLNPFGVEVAPICHERPLMSAIIDHDLEAVKKAINKEHAVDAVDAVDEEGKTPLHYAAEHDNAEASQLLINAGADWKRKDLFGSTPLRIAIYHNSLKALRVLIKEVEKSDLDELLRDVACIKKRGQAAQLLIEAGADINSTMELGYTALHVAAEKDNLDVALVLIGAGDDINKETEYGWTPLSLASAWKSSKKVAKLLIEQGADLSKADRYGCTALFRAAQYCNLEIVKMLIKAGADLNEETHNGCTVLCIAVKSKCYEAAQLLIDAGADVNKINKDGVTVIQRAAAGGNEEFLELLIEAGAYVQSEVHDEYRLLHFVLGGAIVILAVLVFVKSRYLAGDCLYRASQLCTQAGRQFSGM